MSWEDSKACTPLKRGFLRAWFAQEQRFPAWMIRELSLAELQSFVKRLRLAIADLALPKP